MKKTLVALALAAAAATPALAAPETFVLDGTHTFPRFEYSHFGFSNQVQRFDKTTGTVVYDKVAKTGAVDITIDAKSVNTGYPLFNEHIQGEDFLDTAKYPTITFKSTSVKFDGDKPATIEGNLTIKGITKPVTLTVHLLPGHAAPDAEEGRHRRQRHRQDQALRIQRRQVRPPTSATT